MERSAPIEKVEDVMEKTIYIDEKPVKLKSTAALPKRYKAQFGRDYFADLMKVAKVFGKGTKRNFGIQDISFRL